MGCDGLILCLCVLLKCYQSFWCKLYHLYEEKNLKFWSSEAAGLENVLQQEVKVTNLLFLR